jgi:hypothetical protein
MTLFDRSYWSVAAMSSHRSVRVRRLLSRNAEVSVFHRCVIAVLGVLALSTAAAAGPIKMGDDGSSLDIGELASGGLGLGKAELRALFFRGVDARSAARGCADCLSNNSSLTRVHDNNGAYHSLFALTTHNPNRGGGRGRNAASSTTRTNLLTGANASAAPASLVGAGLPLSSGAGAVTPAAEPGVAAVPEPSSLVFFASGLAGAWVAARRKRALF